MYSARFTHELNLSLLHKGLLMYKLGKTVGKLIHGSNFLDCLEIFNMINGELGMTSSSYISKKEMIFSC